MKVIKCQRCKTEYEVVGDVVEHCITCEVCGNEIAINDSNAACGQEPDVCNLLGIHNDTKQSLSSDSFWNLSGRATRSEYWAFVAPVLISLFFITIAIAIGIVLVAIHNGAPGLVPLHIILFVVVALVYNLLTFPVTVRRLHDRNMSGWFLLAFFVGSLIPVAGWFVGLAQFIIIGCLDGTVGPNEFGPDPKGRKPMQPQFFVPPSSVANHESPEDRLLKLQKLKEAGIVSEAEYEEKRRKLLAEI